MFGIIKSHRIREINDYYATDPKATEFLIRLEKFNKNVWECSCGEFHMSFVLEKHGYNVRKSDIIQRKDGIEKLDFLSSLNNSIWNGDIITNPPYLFAQEFVEKSLSLIPYGNKVAMFLKLTFLEGSRRKKLFEQYPPMRVWVSSSRIMCSKNAMFNVRESSAVCYAWFVWEKGFNGIPQLKWFN